MKKKLALAILAFDGMLFPPTVSAQQIVEPPSLWKEAVIIDGKLDEWGGKLDYYDKENKLWYSIGNDSDFLYMSIYKDDNAQKAIMEGGIRLSFDDGKPTSTKSFAITYGNADGSGTNLSHDFERIIVAHFRESKIDTLPIYNEYGIQAYGIFVRDMVNRPVENVLLENMEVDKSTYSLEIAIPRIYLPQSRLHYTICLRGSDLDGSGTMYGHFMKSFVPPFKAPILKEYAERLLVSKSRGIYHLATKPAP